VPELFSSAENSPERRTNRSSNVCEKLRISSKDSLLLYCDETCIPFKLGQNIKLNVEVNQKSSLGMKLEKYNSRLELSQAKTLAALDGVMKLFSTFNRILPRDGVNVSNAQIFKVIIIFVYHSCIYRIAY